MDISNVIFQNGGQRGVSTRPESFLTVCVRACMGKRREGEDGSVRRKGIKKQRLAKRERETVTCSKRTLPPHCISKERVCTERAPRKSDL